MISTDLRDKYGPATSIRCQRPAELPLTLQRDEEDNSGRKRNENESRKSYCIFPVFPLKTYALRAVEGGREKRVETCFKSGGKVI